MTAGSKERLTDFVKGLKDEMIRKKNEKRILLALPTKPENLAKQYDVKSLSKYVDLFTLSSHYLVDDEESFSTFHPSRLMGLFDMLNTDSLVDLISGLGAPKKKILVSLPAAAYKFTLKDKKENTPRSATTEEAPAVLSRKELCELMSEGEWTVERDEDLTAPYAFKDDTWIAFEDKISAGIKGKYALLRELAGLGIHDVEHDLKSHCGKPLTHEVYHSFTDMKRKTRAAVLSSLENDLHHAQMPYTSHVKSSGFRIVRVVDTEGHIHAIRENTQTEFSCTRQGYFVHPKSCNRFYRCVKFNQGIDDYSVFEFDCPAGLAFDERTEVCVWPGSLSEGSPCPGSSEIAPVPQAKFQCPAQPGYYADRQNCRWFFACFDLGGPELTAYEFRCPFGLVFDEEKLICEWPWLVPGCGVSGYSRTEYGGSGAGYAGGSGYSGAGGAGSGIGYGGIGEGNGAGAGAGPGYSGGAGSGHSGAGTGYAGGAGAGYGGADGSAHSGAGPGSGYSGAGDAGHSGAGAGIGYSGIGGSGHSGAGSGSGYSGAGIGYSGIGGAGHSGAGSGIGYAGGAGSGNSGAGSGSGYSGAGIGYSGISGAGHSGAGSGIGYGGGAGSGNSGAGSGSGYSGAGGASHSGAGAGIGYSGIGGAGHAGAGSGIGYAGSAGSGNSGAGSGSGYSGAGGASHSGAGAGIGYSGIGGAGHAGAGSGIGYAGSAGSGNSGAGSGSGYSGAGGASHSGVGAGVGYSGIGGAGHSGAGSDIGYAGVGSGSGYTEAVGAGHSGTGAGIGYSGIDGAGHSGAGTGSGSGYTTSAGSGHFGSGGQGGYTELAGAGHSGTSGNVYPGSSGFSTGAGYEGAGAGHSTGGGYSGSTGAGHSTGAGYTGSGFEGHSTGSGNIGGAGYSGSNSAGNSAGVGYSSTTGAGHTIGAGYSGATGADSSGSTYSGSSGAGYTGASGVGYSGSAGTGYSGATGSGYTGATGSGYDGSSGSGYAGSTGYDGSGLSTVYDGSHGIGSTGILAGHGGESTGYSGSTGTGATRGHGVISTSTTTYHGNTGSHGSSPGRGSFGGSTVYHGNTGSDGGYVLGGSTGAHGAITSDNAGGYVVDDGSSHGVKLSTGKTSTFYGNTGSQGPYLVGGTTSGVRYPAGGTTYYGNAGSPGTYVIGAGSSDHSSLFGKGVTPVGTTTYYGNAGSGGYTGTIVTGDNIHGAIATDASNSGTLLTHGDVAGTILGGSQKQGTIIAGSVTPGYVETSSGTPGYVISGGVKETYIGSSSPGTIVHGTTAPGVLITGTSAPGTIIKGDSSHGVLLTGQTAPGVILGGTVQPGVVIGDSTGSHYTGSSTYQGNTGSSGTGSIYTGAGTTTYHGNRGSGYTGSSTTTYHGKTGTSGNGNLFSGSTKGGSQFTDTGYKTNEYHDNGGRGTIRLNNGYITSKYSETDLPDYRPAYGSLPDSVVSGGRVDGSGGVILGTTLAGVNGYGTKLKTGGSYTQGGFTKTGSTKTGITTAQLGGSASYVAATGRPRPRPNLENIGAKAFEGNTGYSGSTVATDVNNLAYVTSTVTPEVYVSSTPGIDVSHIDASRITLGTTKSGASSGYSYAKPTVQFNSRRPIGSTVSPISSTYAEIPVAVTTPAPQLNIEVYNTPSVVTSAPITAAPAVVNTYSYRKPTNVQYQETLYQAAKVPTGPTVSSVSFGSRPSNIRKYPTPTVIPVGYTTGPLENFKSTIYQAAKVPTVISTVQPVVDNGYKTIVSPTVLPVKNVVNTGKFTYKDSRFQTGTLPTVHPEVEVDLSYQQQGYTGDKEYIAVTTAAPAVSTGYVYNRPRRPLLTKIPVSTSAPVTVTYEQPSVTSQQQVHYVPVSTVAPAIGVTYRKPFQPIGISYKQPTVQVSSTVKPATVSQGYSYSRPSVQFVSTTPASYTVSQNVQPIGTVSEIAGGSPANLEIPRNEVHKLVTNYEARGNVKYTPNVYDIYTGDAGPKYVTSGPVSSTPSYSSEEYNGQYVSSTVIPYRKTVTPSVTTISGGYSTGYSTTPLYEVATAKSPAAAKGKIIVKLSDLHPLLLGKIGAQCTCKEDPYANLRGPGRKSLRIPSSNGPVDLANYDESEIYVDLETDKGLGLNGPGLTGNYVSSTASPVAISSYKTPVTGVFGVSPNDNQGYNLRGRPSTTYLPVSSTSSPKILLTKNRGGPAGSSGPSYSSGSELGSSPASSNREDIPLGRSAGARVKSPKALGQFGANGNAVGQAGAAFDRYGPGGWRGVDETLQGSTDCARPGLFRHPKYCNKFYACHWDEWKQRFTLHVFNCPVHLSFDSNAGACNWPSKGPACQDDNLLV
ncbi:mucin-19 isoform X1 [Cephus cinctus]|uniref:Mucin-19 isoform X1 n=1 Tax=Cephus cinctus TaxID=211228 RepID=A0AAJ7C6A6_CEPCN|nr:mucin-19 isoform X1 [Cephus cinctus]